MSTRKAISEFPPGAAVVMRERMDAEIRETVYEIKAKCMVSVVSVRQGTVGERPRYERHASVTNKPMPINGRYPVEAYGGSVFDLG